MAEGIHPPACFRCPLSLELMLDPVSLCTGVSYERSSIQKWLEKHNTCPSTSQKLSSRDLTPNHTLRRLIFQWQALHKKMGAKMGVEPPTLVEQGAFSGMVERLVQALAGSREELMRVLRELRLMARESSRSSRLIGESEAAVAALASILSGRRMDRCCREEALAILILVPLSSSKRRMLAGNKLFIAGVCWLLKQSSGDDSRANAATLLEIVAGGERDLKILVGASEKTFSGLVELLQVGKNPVALRAGLRTLMSLFSPRRNRIQAVEAGVAEALVGILPRLTDRATCENALALLEMTCRCAEGRAAVSEIETGIGAIAGKIMSVSEASTEYSVRSLWAICKHSVDGEGIQRRLVEAGVVSKLVLMLQMDFSSATKHTMSDLLKLLCNIHQHCPDVAVQDRIHLASF